MSSMWSPHSQRCLGLFHYPFLCYKHPKFLGGTPTPIFSGQVDFMGLTVPRS